MRSRYTFFETFCPTRRSERDASGPSKLRLGGDFHALRYSGAHAERNDDTLPARRTS
jgi:hypothetical protein